MSGLPPYDVASPCRDICQLDAGNICVGCGRSVAEITEWSRASRERKLQICALARVRVELASKAPQGGKFLDRGPT